LGALTPFLCVQQAKMEEKAKYRLDKAHFYNRGEAQAKKQQ
jgi:hypothetical protein